MINQKLRNLLENPHTNLKYILIVVILALFVGGGILGYQCLLIRERENILAKSYSKYKTIPSLTAFYKQEGSLTEINPVSGSSKNYPASTIIILLKKNNIEKVGINPTIEMPESKVSIPNFEELTSTLETFWKEQIKDERYIFEDKSYNCYVSYIEETRNQTTGETETIKKWTCDENVTTVGLLKSSISEIYNSLITLQKDKKLNIKSVRNTNINNRACKLVEFQPDFSGFMKVFKESINLENVEKGDISGSVCIDENGILIRYGINFNASFKQEVIPLKQKGTSEFEIAELNFNELSNDLFILPTEK